MNRFYSICIFLCALFSIDGAQAQSADPFVEANALFKELKYYQASLAYERIVFTAVDELTRARANLKRTECLKQVGQYDKAIHCLERISMPLVPDSIRAQTLYQMALVSYLNGRFKEAEYHINRLERTPNAAVIIADSKLIKLLTLNELLKWEDAKAIALEMAAIAPTTQRDSVTQLIETWYSKKGLPKLKKERRAELLSTFFPGSGQVYVGKPLEGLFNFTLQVATIAYSVFNILSANYISAAGVSVTLFRTFYTGGITRTKFLARQHNHRVVREFNDKVNALFVNLQLQAS